MSASKILFSLCLSFIAGIFFESLTVSPPILIWGILVLGNFFIVASFFTERIGFVVGFCVLFFIIGAMRMQISEFSTANNKLSKLNDREEMSFVGIVIDEPDIRDTYQKIKIETNDGIILVTTSRHPEYQYLQELKITGDLESPAATGGFSYKNYLLKDHIFSVISFPKIEIVAEKRGHGATSFLYEKILFLKQKMRESISRHLPPSQSSILEGMILGDSGAITTEIKDKLSATGLSHIVAVSGTHIVILSSIVMLMLLSMGLWRRQAFFLTILFVGAYVVLTGLHSSGVRAGIMGVIYLLSQQVGRQVMPVRLVALTCAVMLSINPLLLLYDIGFQLSFMSILGLIYLGPSAKEFLLRVSKNKAENLVAIISATLSAQVFTLPIVVYNFGNISFVAPVTNLLVLPMVYWFMIFGFLVAVLGIFSGLLGWLLSLPCWILLMYFFKIIEVFSQPWMVKTIENVSWVWLVVPYFIISIGVRLVNSYRSNIFIPQE